MATTLGVDLIPLSVDDLVSAACTKFTAESGDECDFGEVEIATCYFQHC